MTMVCIAITRCAEIAIHNAVVAAHYMVVSIRHMVVATCAMALAALCRAVAIRYMVYEETKAVGPIWL